MAQCKKCGETFRFFDRFCRKCGEKRESLPYGTVNESESDFAVHSERYIYSGSSVVGQNNSYFPMKFCEHEGFIYAWDEWSAKGAVVRINAKGKHLWIRLENAEEIIGNGVILVNSAGIFIQNTKTEYFLYNKIGKLLKKINLECADAEFKDVYVFRDKMYILYCKSEGSVMTPFVVEYDVTKDKKRVVLNFETLWNEIIEYARLGEIELRRGGRSCLEEKIPDVIYKEEIDHLYASAEQFGVNSRRLVMAFSIEIDSNIIGYSGTLLLDVNLDDLTVTLLREMGSKNNYSEEKSISFLDMSSETFWFTNQVCDRDFLFHDYMEPFETPLIEEFSSNRWRDLRFAAQYMDGENMYGAKPHAFCSVSREGITTDWAQESDGDIPQLTVLGDFLYERHGDAYYSDDTWNFYYKRNEPVLAFSVSVKDIEKEYNHLDLYLTADEYEDRV